MARFFATLFSLLVGLASAGPYTPSSDNQILATLSRAEQAMGQRTPPASEAEAVRQARQYIDYARQQEDSRFLGYARASLSPWLTGAPSPSVAQLMADIQQRQHQFGRAIETLETLLQRRPNEGQAWLMLANLHRVQGRFAEARRACGQAARSLPPTTVVICQSSVQAMTGQLPQAWQILQRLADSDKVTAAAPRRWMYTLLAEMAIQQGLEARAHDYLTRALQFAPQDPYLRYLQSDLWLTQDLPHKVIAALQQWEDRENALLRLAIAGQRSEHPQADHWRQAYQSRLDAARQSDRDIHLREQARFLLQVARQPNDALEAASRNWDSQRELRDLRILTASALGSDNPRALQQATTFMDRHGTRDSITLHFLSETGP